MAFVGKSAFEGCNVLGSISLPDAIKTIDYRAFYECYGLHTVTIGKGIETIANEAFRSSGISSITIPIDAALTTIGERAFAGCNNLKEFIMPDAVTTMGKSAFSRCQTLANVTLGKNLKKLENESFVGCSALLKVSIPEDAILSSIDGGVFRDCI